jgi:dipeptidyl aminopeptidase/acylaminoacyl peptidase
VTKTGVLYYGLRVGATDVAVARGSESPLVLPTRTPGRNLAPAWSRDGNHLAYLSLRGAQNFGVQSRVIVVRDMAKGTERDLEARLAHVESLRWSPDGEWLLASGSDGKGRSGLFRVRTRDGAIRPELVDEQADYHGAAGDWQPDGTVAAAQGAHAVAVSSSGRVARAYADKVVVNETVYRIDGVTWLAWAGERLLAAQSSRAVEFSPQGPRELHWKGYSGGPFSVRPDGSVAFAVGSARQEVRAMEGVFGPLAHRR